MFSGFTLIIMTVFVFFYFNDLKGDEILLELIIPPEELIKFCLILLMSLALFIPPITFSKSVIDWNQVGLLNR